MSDLRLRRAVRKLYKQLMFAGKFYSVPGYEKVKEQAKREFLKHKDLSDPVSTSMQVVIMTKSLFYVFDRKRLNRRLPGVGTC